MRAENEYCDRCCKLIKPTVGREKCKCNLRDRVIYLEKVIDKATNEDESGCFKVINDFAFEYFVNF